ncbi:MAG: dephospho-CoA kinase [Candidatus Izemoplasmatales bacterium]|jgi:dephospho-CoA kinase|nr:dephospho-CoA kinase [Candidatus Izemoplasmatales bacterium]
MIRIGLTGGIASGKSLVSSYFQELDIPILDADKIYKNLLKTNKLLYNEIKKTFNLEDFTLKQLGEIVFDDQTKLKTLNKIAHPYVIRYFAEQLEKMAKTEKFVVLDIPLLFEAKMESYCDVIICVYVDEIIQIERLMKRNNLTKEEALKRINSQMPLSEKCKISDYVIDNSQERDYTYQQFTEIFNKIKENKNVT